MRARFPFGNTSRSARPLGILYWSHGTAVGPYKTSPKRLVIAGGDFSKLAISACFRYGDTTSARGRSSARPWSRSELCNYIISDLNQDEYFRVDGRLVAGVGRKGVIANRDEARSPARVPVSAGSRYRRCKV